MDDFVQLLRACFDKDDAVARSATPGPWAVDGGSVYVGHPTNEVVDYSESADHIARHNPARVLAEVDAKRRIIDEHPPGLGWDGSSLDGPVCRTCAEAGNGGELTGDPYPCTTLRLLALPYANHADFRPEWAPDQA